MINTEDGLVWNRDIWVGERRSGRTYCLSFLPSHADACWEVHHPDLVDSPTLPRAALLLATLEYGKVLSGLPALLRPLPRDPNMVGRIMAPVLPKEPTS